MLKNVTCFWGGKIWLKRAKNFKSGIFGIFGKRNFDVSPAGVVWGIYVMDNAIIIKERI